MTFNEWLEYAYPEYTKNNFHFFQVSYDVVTDMEEAWNAAKEDTTRNQLDCPKCPMWKENWNYCASCGKRFKTKETL